jgi:polysaccharide biosynthesis protein PslH
MGSRKSLLFVTDVTPYPLDRGQRVRVHHLLTGCRRVFDVTLVSPPPALEEDRERVLRECAGTVWVENLRSYDLLERTQLAASVVRAVPGIPRFSTVAQYAPFVAALQQVDPASFDIVWAERPHIAKLFGSVRSKTILDLDDLEHVKIARLMKVQTAIRERLRSTYRYAFYRHLEVTWARQFFATVVCSEEDRRYLAERGCHNAVVVPNGPGTWNDDGDPPTRRTREAGAPLRVVFLGNVASEPNADAIAYFAERILPPLAARFPGASLDVVGPNATTEVVDRYAGRVHFRGFAEDLGAALAEYDVMIVPLRFGGGTKLKVLDGMAHGIPVVTTHVGAEGLALDDGVHALLAETPDEFVRSIERIKEDPSLGARLSRNAYEHVRARFTGSAIQDGIVEWLSRVVSP